jgi:hypothetical protein
VSLNDEGRPPAPSLASSASRPVPHRLYRRSQAGAPSHSCAISARPTARPCDVRASWPIRPVPAAKKSMAGVGYTPSPGAETTGAKLLHPYPSDRRSRRGVDDATPGHAPQRRVTLPHGAPGAMGRQQPLQGTPDSLLCTAAASATRGGCRKNPRGAEAVAVKLEEVVCRCDEPPFASARRPASRWKRLIWRLNLSSPNTGSMVT